MKSRFWQGASGLFVLFVLCGVQFVYAQSPVKPKDTLPAPWKTQDIGAVGKAGSASIVGTTMTVQGAGNDIGQKTDQFRYTYYPLQGNGQLTAAISSRSSNDALAKAGIMLRGSLADNAPYILVGLTGVSTTLFQWRSPTVTGSRGSVIGKSVVKLPYWLRLTRTGNLLVGSVSVNGITWTVLNQVTLKFPATGTFIGFAVSSHSTKILNTMVFTHVTMPVLPTPTPTLKPTPSPSPTPIPTLPPPPTPIPPTSLTTNETQLPPGLEATLNIAVGPDHNLWFTATNGNQIGHIASKGVITEYPIPTPNSEPWGITSGPDGNLWFTEFKANKIGLITPSGGIKQYALPTANSGPWAITTGHDGNLWFTELTSGKIGRITPAGIVTQYTLPINSTPRYITMGSDHNLWFTENTFNTIGRITPKGTITTFKLPTAAANPYGITPGSDSNLWFTEFNVDKIGRITTTGTITEYALPTIGAAPYGITPGPDGNLWFSEFASNKVGRITPTGLFLEYPLPLTDGGPWNIITTPDGNLHFTVHNGSEIGFVSLAISLVITIHSHS